MAEKIVQVEMNVRVWRTETFIIRCQDEVATGSVVSQLIIDPNKLWGYDYELDESEDWDSQIESMGKIEVYDA